MPHNSLENHSREQRIYLVTIAGGIINVALLILKFVAGIMGASAAMIADAAHSLSDFLTDLVVLLFVKIGNKPQDRNHDYGHGKFETLATALIGLALFAVGCMLCYQGITKVVAVCHGEMLQVPGIIAFIASLISIGLKEWAYYFTIKVGKQEHTQVLIANAWHHRSDAFSSLATSIGIGGAIILGKNWAVLDPLAAIVVSVYIMRAAYLLVRQAVDDLLEISLPDDVEDEIVALAAQEEGVTDIHHLCTRRMGNNIAIEMDMRMDGATSLYEAHCRGNRIEVRLRKRFGEGTHIILHFEPIKINGRYVAPKQEKRKEKMFYIKKEKHFVDNQ